MKFFIFSKACVLMLFGATIINIQTSYCFDLNGSYTGLVTITQPADLGVIDLAVELEDQDGSLTGYIDTTRTLVFPKDIVTGNGPIVTGSFDCIFFTVSSEVFSGQISGIPVSRQITLSSATPCDKSDMVEGEYIESISGFTPDPITIQGTFVLSRPPVPGYSKQQVLTFRPGWNFFSLEVEPDNPAVEDLLSAGESAVKEVWAFSPLQNTYYGYVPAEGLSDLSELHAQNGYLMHAAFHVSMVVSGKIVTDDINLTTGWNLIPCPANTETPIEEVLASIEGKFESVWYYNTIDATWKHFDPDGPTFLNDLMTMKPGNAYWLKMNVDVKLPYVEN